MSEEDKDKPVNAVLFEVQQKLQAKKEQHNDFGKYNYRSIEDIVEAVKPLIAPYKATVLFSDGIEQIGDRYYIKSDAILMMPNGHFVTNTAYAREPLELKGQTPAQITGGCSSYARKYAACGLFAVDSGEHDPDKDKKVRDAKDSKSQAEKLRNPLRKSIQELLARTGDVQFVPEKDKKGSVAEFLEWSIKNPSEGRMSFFNNAIKALRDKDAEKDDIPMGDSKPDKEPTAETTPKKQAKKKKEIKQIKPTLPQEETEPAEEPLTEEEQEAKLDAMNRADTPRDKLEQMAEKDGISKEELSEWAKGRKLPLNKEGNVKRCLENWSKAKSLILTAREANNNE